MATQSGTYLQENHTPEVMTKVISKKLATDLENYDRVSKAYVATFPGHIEGPVWCMDLHVGKKVHLAILEEFTAELTIYTESLRPRIYFSDNQVWETEKDGVRHSWQLYKNSKNKYCLRYTRE